MCVLASFAVLVAVTAIAAASGGRHDSHAAARLVMPGESSGELRRLRLAAAARMARLHSPAMARVRRRSRTAFKGTSRADALATLRQFFSDVLDSPVYTGLRLRPGERVDDYLGDNSAVVAQAGTDKRAVAQSTLPLLTRDAAGQKVPVDLTLERHGRRLESKAPLDHASIADDAQTGFALTDVGVTVHPDAPAGVAGDEVASKVFFPSVAADTDMLELPVPGGVETFSVLRSSASPEDLNFTLDLPAGATLRLVAGSTGLPGGAEVVKDQTVLLAIPAPVARDANGEIVPVSLRTDGRQLTLHVAHRAGNFRYPLLVDPTYIQNGTTAPSNFAGWQNTGWAGWQSGTTNPNYSLPAGVSTYNFSRLGVKQGLMIEAFGPIRAGDFSNWLWTAPANAYIYRAEWEFVSFQWLYEVVNEGISLRGSWEQVDQQLNGQTTQGGLHQITGDVNNQYFTACLQAASVCDQNPPGVHDGNMMVFGMQDPYVDADFSAPNNVAAVMQGADVYLRDNHSPVIDSLSTDAGNTWHDLNAGTVTINAHDDGLGLATTTIARPTVFSTTDGWACNGQINNPCPTSATAKSLTYPIKDLPEGIDTLSVSVTDIVGNQSAPQSWPVKVDHTPPTLGPLAGDSWIKKGLTYSASGSASDGNSGVQRVDLVVDGGHVSGIPAPPSDDCGTDGCPTNRSGALSWDTSAAAEGLHPARLYARDPLNHQVTSATWNVGVDGTAPTVTASGSVATNNGRWVQEGTYHLDATAADSGSGVKGLHIVVDGVEQDPASATRSCPAAGCTASMSRAYDFDTTDWGQGVHSVQITAEDLTGNQSTTQTFTLKVDEEQPQADITGPLMGADGATIGDGNYVQVVAADDSGDAASGIKSIDVTVDGSSIFHADGTCDATSCGATLTSSWAYRPTADGTHTFEVTVTDAAGNQTTDSSTVSFDKISALPPLAIGVASQPDMQINGAAAGDAAGSSLANVGDVNGDGYDDYLVGAPGAGTGAKLGAGAAYVVLGSDDTTPVDLGNPPPGRVLTFTGARPGDRAGYAVAAGGDVNGDGYPDLLIGAPGPTSALTAIQGHVYVVFGGPSLASADLGALGSSGYEIDGPPETPTLVSLLGGPSPTTFGSQIAGRKVGDFSVDGDVNGDQLDDVVIGDASDNRSLRPGGGTTYVIFGKTDTAPVNLAATAGDPGTGGFRVFGAAIGDTSGQGTALVGDVNADGYADLTITAPGANAAGRTSAGTAYVVFGKPDSTFVDLLTQVGQAYAIRGNTGDNITTVSPIGDVNSDEAPDILLGGHGGWLLYGKSTTDTVDLGAAFSGYKMTAPAGPGYDAAQVASPGDVDGDDSPDAFIGFPQANNGDGVGYIVYGRETAQTPIDLATLQGQQGTTISGPAASQTGAAADGIDSGPNDEQTTAVGAPKAQSGAGAVYVTAAHRASRKQVEDSKGCYKRHTAYPFPYYNSIVPKCRHGRDGVIDSPFTRTSKRVKYVPNRSAYGGGNARRTRYDVKDQGVRIPVVDSFNKTFAFIQENRRYCWTVFSAAGQPVGDTYSGPNAGCENKKNPTRKRLGYGPTHLEVQGKACMKTDALENSHVIVGLISGKASESEEQDLTKDGTYIGLRGFIPRSELPNLPPVVDQAYPGCGRYGDYKRLRRRSFPPLSEPQFDRYPDPNTGVRPDLYVSRNSYNSCIALTNCGAQLANYQGNPFTSDVALITTATTAVGAHSGFSGIVRAIVADASSASFRKYDDTSYEDPNIPCKQNRVARWNFGDVNPGAENDQRGQSTNDHPIFGWTPRKNEVPHSGRC
jgi:hypothetical protein